MFKKLLYNQLLTTFTARGVAAGGTFLLSFVLAKFVSVQAFGAFMLSMSVMIGLQVFTSLGTDRATLKYMGVANSNNNKSEVKWVYQIALIVNMTLGCLFSFILWVLAPQVSELLFNSIDNGVSVLKATAVISPIYGVIYLCNFIMKGWGKANVSCLFEIGCISILLSLMIVIGRTLGFELKALELVAMLGSLLFLYSLIAIWFVLRLYSKSELVLKRENSITKGFYKSLPDFLLVGVIFYYTQWGAGIVLGLFHDEKDVAIFTLGLRLAMIIGFILTVYDSILGPKFASLHHEKNHEGLKKLAQKSAFQMTCVSLIPAIVFILWPELVLILFGADYSGAASVIRILVIGQLINVMTGSIILLLLMADEQKSARNILICSVVFGGAASLILIPSYSANGAAISLLLCLLIQNLAALYIVRKKFGFLITDWREEIGFKKAKFKH